MNNPHPFDLTIYNFQGSLPLELQKLGWINLFVGANNCGKTRALHGIRRYCDSSGLSVANVDIYPLLLIPRSPQDASKLTELVAIVDPSVVELDEKLGFYRKEGRGVNRLLEIAIAVTYAAGGVLLIDDIESGIYLAQHSDVAHKAFAWIAQWAKQHSVQIFATTHSLEIVDALIDATSEDLDLVLHRLEPLESKVRVVRHGRDRLKRLRENLGQDVR